MEFSNTMADSDILYMTPKGEPCMLYRDGRLLHFVQVQGHTGWRSVQYFLDFIFEERPDVRNTSEGQEGTL